MNGLMLMVLAAPLALALGFALARIALRLRQSPALAALAAVLIGWQMVALAAGRAPLASSVTLLITGSGLIALIQWLRANNHISGASSWAAYLLAGLLVALAASFPSLKAGEALAFTVTLGFSGIGVGIAIRRARSPLPIAGPGAAALPAPCLWLLARLVALFSG